MNKDELASIAGEIIRELPTAILRWYEFRDGASVLYIGDIVDAVAVMLREEKHLQVTATTLAEAMQFAQSFDYVVCIGALEKQKSPVPVLRHLSELLAPYGVLLLGMNNRLGIRYFCGDRDLYTERSFDGVEDYRRAYSRSEDTFNGRMYSRAELEKMLSAVGLQAKFFSVVSDLSNPTFLNADDYVPNEDFCNRVFPTYHYPATVFLEEEALYQSLLENGMLYRMANAYLLECTVNGKLSDVRHVTSSLERGKKLATLTIIKNDSVIKRAAYDEGKERFLSMPGYLAELRARGIRTVDGTLDGGGSYVMPFVEADTGQVYLKKLLLSDKHKFLDAMDHFRDLILASSEIYEGVYRLSLKEENRPYPEDEKPTMLFRHAFLDMVPLNSFFMDGEFVFYDQEYIEENYPVNMVLTRMVGSVYSGNPRLNAILPVNELLARYGLLEEAERWYRLEWQFLTTIRKEKELADYHQKVRRDAITVNANRQRMNYSVDDYQRLFVDIFEYADTRKLILFGSGKFAERFMSLYGEDYPIYAVVDNNENRWGETLGGVRIESPDLFSQMHHGEYKIIVCIKNYLSVMQQLDGLGIKEYAIFDPAKAYPRKRHPIPRAKDSVKKYHVGYIAGVFDLFHVGHVRLLQRAKEQCDYLIVGVVSDEGVTKFKRVTPFVPFAERIEMVRSCHYVDEAVEIPLYFGGTQDAWRMHHFDAQFSGSDYADNPDWLREKEFLERHGATMVFFPYTESTSSTKLKTLIEKKLL